jgi:ABC-type polysaccharide/polyol phosphate transport system ATPase subunit
MDIGSNLCGLRSNSQSLRHDEFWALKDISFEVKRGEAFALVGANGAGKTTLLKMLNGIFWPDEGKISITGRIGPLIAVGAGFHPLLSGRENIYINAAILGIGKKEIERKFDAIVDFADIGEFLDTPVKNYSSGMFVRLGFAVAVHCEPDILLIDEILSVGDMNFQSKCMDKMQQFIRGGKTIIYISHNLNSVMSMCQRAILLEDSKVVTEGDARSVVDAYRKRVVYGKRVLSDGIRHGSGDVEITNVQFLDTHGNPKQVFNRGEFFQLKVFYNAHKPIPDPQVLIKFFTDKRIMVTEPSSRHHKLDLDGIIGKGEITYTIESLPFNAGRYPLAISILDATGIMTYDAHEHLHELVVEKSEKNPIIPLCGGLVYVPGEWKVRQG